MTNQTVITRYLFILLTFLSVNTSAQESWDDFSGPEKAFFYRIARTTDILKKEVFHLMEFSDSIPYINDTLPDYKYVEKQIVNDADKLTFYTDQTSRISSGILNDLATHFALWELGQVLHFRQSTDEKDKPLKEKLKVFEKYVVEKAPQSAITTLSDGSYVLRNSLASYYSHSLLCSDKMASMKNSGFVQLDQMLCLNAITYAMEKYVAKRSEEVFKILGGTDEEYQNFLSVGGDGRQYSGSEAGYKATPQNHLIPDNMGLFNFRIYEKLEEQKTKNEKKSDKKNLTVKDVIIRDMQTNFDLNTVLHFDVYNWHKERQTTIVIQKGGNSYILYGNNDNRLLSPDSTYGEGSTYRRLMWELEHVHIAYLKEMLYGKRGYEWQIDQCEKRIQSCLLAIKKTEFKLDNLRHQPQPKPKVKKKKWRKIDLTTSYQDGQGHPSDKLTKNQKKINIEQNRLNYLEGVLRAEKQELARLTKEMEEAYFLLVRLENKLDMMHKNLGLIEMDWEEENEFYTFRDGATFNRRTQDFTFPADGGTEGFKVYHITFGAKVFATEIEETFVHIHKTIAKPGAKYAFHKVARDRDTWSGRMSESDSIQTMEIFRALMNKETKAEIEVVAGGIIGEAGGEIFRKETLEPIDFQEGQRGKPGVTIYHAEYDAALKMKVEVYEGQMKPANFDVSYPKYAKFNSKYPDLNEIDYYSGSRALQTAHAWILSLKTLVPQWIEDPKDQAMILSKLNKLKPKKAFFADGKYEIKVPFVKPVNG